VAPEQQPIKAQEPAAPLPAQGQPAPAAGADAANATAPADGKKKKRNKKIKKTAAATPVAVAPDQIAAGSPQQSAVVVPPDSSKVPELVAAAPTPVLAPANSAIGTQAAPTLAAPTPASSPRNRAVPADGDTFGRGTLGTPGAQAGAKDSTAKAPDASAPVEKQKDEHKPATQPTEVAGSNPAAADVSDAESAWVPEVRDATKAAEPVAAALTAMAADTPITGAAAVNGTDPVAHKKGRKKKNKNSKARKVDAGATAAAPAAAPAASATSTAKV
jgi:hypothetical protein